MPGVRVDEHVGRMLGERYRLEAPVGSGASARVYLAEDVSLRRPVAVKLLHTGLADDSRFAKRFRNEAQAAAQLAHPRILAVFDWSEHDELYLVTELLAGGSLRQMLDAGHKLSLSQALVVGLHAAEGLVFAHSQGFVHRDIKPANLLFGLDGRLRIADFGIARAVAEAAWTEPEGALIGTAKYAAPEQASGKTPRGEADVYSLAITLIEATTGEVPLVGATPLATMVMRQDTDVPVPSSLGPLIPALVLAGQADPAKRVSALDFGRMLNEAAGRLARPRVLPLAGLPGGELADYDRAASVETGSGGYVDSSGEIILDDGLSGQTETVMLGDGTALDGTPIHFADDDEPRVPDGPDFSEDLAKLALDRDPDTPDSDYVDFIEARRRKWPVVLALLGLVGAVSAGAAWLLRPEPPVIEHAALRGTVVPLFVGEQFDQIAPEVAANEWVASELNQRAEDSVPGEVLAQVPIAGARLESGRTVTLVVSEGLPLVKIPDLAGVTVDEARVLLAAAGLRVGTRSASYSDSNPARTVMSQGLEPGIQAEHGTKVDLLLSGGPAPRSVPNLLGLDLPTAEAKLAELGLLVAPDDGEFSETFAEGQIVRTDPVGDNMVEVGSTVTVILSKGLPFVTVPNLRGLDASDAADLLTRAGFVVDSVDGNPNRPVLITDPPPGESHRKGTRIKIITRR